MISRSFMHHSYIPWDIDEKKTPYFSPQYEQKPVLQFVEHSFCFSKCTSLTKRKILDGDSSLHFALLRLQLVELIRTCTSTPGGDITPALTFATTQLAPRAPTKKEFLEDLERTMALLIFPPDNL